MKSFKDLSVKFCPGNLSFRSFTYIHTYMSLYIRPVAEAIKIRLKCLYVRSRITEFSIDLSVIRIQFNIGRNTVSNIVYV